MCIYIMCAKYFNSRAIRIAFSIKVLWFVAVCPDDFVEHDGKCYGSPPQLATWWEAKTHCSQIGSSYNLVVIEDESEYERIKDKIQSHSNGQQFWIGLRETEARDTFEWVDGSSLSYGATFYSYPWRIWSSSDKEPNSVSNLTFLFV